MNRKLGLLIASMALSGVVLAQPAPRDIAFAGAAAQGNRAEVMLGRLASQRGGTTDIRSFGVHMVNEHSMALAQLETIARRKRIVLPKGVEPEAQRLYDRLSRLRGRAFDRLYKREMIEDHMKDIGEFQKESRNGRDAQLRSYATQTLPHLREHLRRIRRAHA